MSYLSTVIIAAVVDLVWTQTQPPITSCLQLPKLPMPNIWALIDNSPYVADYTMLDIPQCATSVFVSKVRRSTGYEGSLINMQSNGANVYDYNLSSDQKTIDMTICVSGAVQVWYLAAIDFNANGSFFCIYTCSGTDLIEFRCNSNNRTAFDDDEKSAIALAKQVPNAQKIHALGNSCFNNGCQAFY